ncbi:short-chain dehydrogenase [Desulfuromonas versatilis]|uniref:Short-chain dehydrogenase n=1 Tax=Desulfuromonas versatilis TaxID=2802975 RepID=A0ABM8HZS7_9BACT|nr:SDR family oxidoreductase [Desulfuromonas versatilis]BCR06236.1 short-chain dehydrogenase [Desulfuromonas versatilis]
MNLKLEDKLAIVTGSTDGIGKAIAARLAAEGAQVVINGRNREKAERVAADLGHPGRVHAVAADLSGAEGVRGLFAAARKIAPIDILVNNFGIFEPKPFELISDEDWLRFFNLNVLSAVRCSREAMGGMRERGWGRILFISSESGINIPVEMVHYGMTKTALLAVSRGLAKTLAGTGVTVNALLPGPTWTEGVAEFVGRLAQERGIAVEQMKEDFFRSARPGSLIRRFAAPEEVANHAAYLCSPLADATTGAAHRVDGGLVDSCC